MSNSAAKAGTGAAKIMNKTRTKALAITDCQRQRCCTRSLVNGSIILRLTVRLACVKAVATLAGLGRTRLQCHSRSEFAGNGEIDFACKAVLA